EAMDRIGLAEEGPQLTQARHRGSEVVVYVALDPDAERRRIADLRAGARSSDEGLRGDAPDVEAVAAQQVLLDQGDAGAQASRAGGRHEAGRAGADHHQVVPAGRLWIDPVGRMHVMNERAVEFVIRLDRDTHETILPESA